MIRAGVSAAIAAMVLSSSHSGAGAASRVVFEVETKEADRSTLNTIVAEEPLLKLSIAGGAGRSDEAIFRGDRREMVIVDHRNQSYMVIDQTMVTRMSAQVDQVTSQRLGNPKGLSRFR